MLEKGLSALLILLHVVARLAYCCIARAYPVYSNVAIYSIQKQTGSFPDASRSEISSSRKPARLIFAMPELIWVKRQDLQAIKALKTRKASCWAWLEARGTEHCLNTSDEECQAARKTMSFKMPNVSVTCCYVCHAFLWCFAFLAVGEWYWYLWTKRHIDPQCLWGSGSQYRLYLQVAMSGSQKKDCKILPRLKLQYAIGKSFTSSQGSHSQAAKLGSFWAFNFNPHLFFMLFKS